MQRASHSTHSRSWVGESITRYRYEKEQANWSSAMMVQCVQRWRLSQEEGRRVIVLIRDVFPSYLHLVHGTALWHHKGENEGLALTSEKGSQTFWGTAELLNFGCSNAPLRKLKELRFAINTYSFLVLYLSCRYAPVRSRFNRKNSLVVVDFDIMSVICWC